MVSALRAEMREKPRALNKRRHPAARVLVLLLAATVMVPAARAQDTLVRLDPGQTKVEISVGSTIHNVHGNFKLKNGELRFDPSSGKASGAIVVAAMSGDTANEGRDKKMHEKVLESEKYPEIVFTPNQVRGKVAAQGNSDVEVAGVFRLHGQDHDLTMKMSVEQRGGNQIQATTHFGVPYIKWGLKNPSNFFLRVEDTVQVEIHAVGQMATEAAHD